MQFPYNEIVAQCMGSAKTKLDWVVTDTADQARLSANDQIPLVGVGFIETSEPETDCVPSMIRRRLQTAAALPAEFRILGNPGHMFSTVLLSGACSVITGQHYSAITAPLRVARKLLGRPDACMQYRASMSEDWVTM